MRWTPAESACDVTLTRSFARCLPGGRLSGPLRAYRSAESTQALARAWADAGAPEGAVVLADYQTAGRGQRGRPWTAPPGTALLFSVVLRPRLPVIRWPQIPLAAGCAVAESLETVAPCAAWLKWPNDVLVAGRKLAGILAEGVASTPPLVILGIGVNVSQRETDWAPDLAGSARSLKSLGAPVSRETLLTTLLAHLDTWYGSLLEVGFEPVRSAWRRRGLLGTRLDLTDGEGTSVDLGPGGELVVRRNDGRLTRLVALPTREPEGIRAEPR
jgi:BirA family transcriptional regulator, biotin operon repressor / biotin---[acetyl-CoA-carboxylase] ligase